MNDYKHKGLGSKSPIISAVNKNVEYFTVRYRYPVTKQAFVYLHCHQYCRYKMLSYDVAVIQWIMSCHK